MDTPTLRQLIRHEMIRYYPQAKLWPNGLGFDYRGWTWGYDETQGVSEIKRWICHKTVKGRRVLGRGANPFDAYAHAVPLKGQP